MHHRGGGNNNRGLPKKKTGAKGAVRREAYLEKEKKGALEGPRHDVGEGLAKRKDGLRGVRKGEGSLKTGSAFQQNKSYRKKKEQERGIKKKSSVRRSVK